MVDLVVTALLPGRAHRCLPAVHPYTEHGLEVEVEADGAWVELCECGLAAPGVLAGAGVDPATHTGLAMGLGLDRALMLRKGIADIRLLRSADPRVAGQLLDLEPYRPVSSLPPVRRDLSLAVAADLDAELLGDRAREALGADAEAVEAIEVLARTAAQDLPPAAIERLGLRPGQVNVLVRLVLRHPTETLTAAQANGLRNVVYAALHEGERHEWAAA
jgi:phenylalanyl-tRNA synthetase alpha chain